MLEVVKFYGIYVVMYCKIVIFVGVLLGLMIYYFLGIDELLLEVFSSFIEIMFW